MSFQCSFHARYLSRLFSYFLSIFKASPAIERAKTDGAKNYRFLQAVCAACPHGLLRGHSRSGHGLLQPRLLLGLRAAAVHVRLWIGKRVPPLSQDGDRRRRGRDEKAAGGHSQKHTFSKLPLLAVDLATAPGDSQGVVGMDHDLAMIEVVDWSPFL